jgi:hypothetical protein
VQLDIIKVPFHQQMHYLFTYEYIKVYVKIRITIAPFNNFNLVFL